MTLEEQWQDDIKQFGELAYLMWDMTEDSKDYYETPYSTGLWLEHNFDCWLRICSREVYRKQSAAIPFDLAAARAGDKVQALRINPEEWIDCTPLLHEKIYTGRCAGNESVPTKEFGWYDQKFLRMKHPRRVGVDYSQFED